MKRLLEGVMEFKRGDFEAHRELFEDIGKGQRPHTLFIGCSDSRVIPNMITKTLPGELFVIRNIANIVPRYEDAQAFSSTISAIEYAVNFLGVEDIVVCGHSNCGGCASLYRDEGFFENLPYTKKWLELAKNVKEKVLEQEPESPGMQEMLTEQVNVVEQMKHLLSYPFISEKYEKKEIRIHGWYYIIETGEVYSYDLDKKSFEAIN